MTSVWGRVVLFLLGAIVLLPSLGCNVYRVTLNTPLTPNDVAFIVPGTTTLSDVVVKLGTPDSLTETASGVVATYRFLDVKYSLVNFGYLAYYWTPVNVDLILSRTGFWIDALEVQCDPQWVVLEQSFHRHLTNRLLHPIPF